MILRKLITQLALASMLALISTAQAEPKTAAQCYEEISKLMASGKVEGALKLMTEKGRNTFLDDSFFVVLDTRSLGEKVEESYSLPDGTKVTVTPADLGLDKLEVPAWFASGELVGEEEEEKFFVTLRGLAGKSEDSANYYRALGLLARKVGGSDFGGKIVPPHADFKAMPERVWAEFEYGKEKELVPIIFKKSGDSWLFDQVDYEVQDAIMVEHVERKDLKISGETVEGKKISLSDYEGKVVLIDFWGTW